MGVVVFVLGMARWQLGNVTLPLFRFSGALRGVNLAVAGLAVRRLGRYLEPCADPTSEDERGKREG